MLRITFIEPRAPGIHVYTRFRMPRMGLPTMATRARELGHKVRVYIEDVGKVDFRAAYDSDLVCLSSISSTAPRAYAYADKFRQRGVPVLMGGPHPTARAQEALQHADWVLRGEADDTFFEFLKKFEARRELTDIEGLSYRTELGCVHNPAPERTVDLDTLPIPDLSLIEGYERMRILPVMTSRGCPFHCRFCTARAHWQGVRWHSAEYVMAEITSGLAEFPDMKRVYFLDDLFIAHKERFEKLHDLWVADPQIRDLPATGFVRAGVFDDDAARMMIDMGFRTVRFGAESGSDRVLELLGKGTTVEDNWRVVEICRRHGLVCTASFMHGIPGETPADAQATRDFIWQSGIRVEGWYKFAQWPGTDMYDGSSPLECDMRVRPSS